MNLRSITLLLVLTLSAQTSLSIATERVLFAFDDHSIPWQHNLKLTLVEADKHPANPVLRRGPENAPDHGHAILYGTVIKDGDTFRMWYLGMFESESKGGQAPGWWRPMCYAESKNGIHWTKPELGLVEFKGNKKNNICLIESSLPSMTRVNDFLSVLHEPNDPDPNQRYKVTYIAHMPYDEIKGGMSQIGTKEKRVCSTICATSADGLTWKVVGDRPANAGGERFEVSSLYHFGDFYYSSGQLLSPWTWHADGSESGRLMLTYRSADFKTWSKATARSLSRPGQASPAMKSGQQMHMGAGLWNRGNVMVGLHGMWQDAAEKPAPGESWNTGVHIDLGLTLSNDGIHFREPVPDFKVIARGKPGSWDDTALLQGHAFVNHGEKTMIWYSHWDTSTKLKSMEIGLATMRRDGFGYLSCQEDDNEAELITIFFKLEKNEKIHLNLDAVSPESPLEIEILDQHAVPMPAYSGTNAIKLIKSGIRVPISWPKSLPSNQKIALRIKYPIGSKAKIYALYLND